jgi:ribose transport system ATP-binding protein
MEEAVARSPTVLTIRHLSKAFGGAQALTDVSLEVLPGEVHGLLGENGSGKSTLIKILAGYHAPDAGEVEVRDIPLRLPLAPGQFRKLGMEFVHQDLGLISGLTALENLRIGEFAAPKNRFYFPWKRERVKARETFGRYGLDLDPMARVGDLQPVERALLAIVRAVEGMREGMTEAHTDHGMLFLDEPTAFLPKDQIDKLFALVRQIVKTKASVVFVSHDLDEVREITDRVTVLRNGHWVGTVATATTSHDELVHLIIGQDLLSLDAAPHDLRDKQPVVRIRNLEGLRLQSTTLDVQAGEVVGLTGLLGAGYEEIPYLLFGAQKCTAGQLVIGEQTTDLRSMTPSAAIDVGIALIPADRQRDGSVGSLSITDNITLPVLSRYFRKLLLLRGRMVRDARRLMGLVDVRPAEPLMTYSALSGGNQQKVLLAKWLQTKPRLLLLHEPTQGVDVGARQKILTLVREAVAEGTVVMCASSDYEQIAMLCDRVLVFARGRLVQELSGDDVTKERITEQCLKSAQG